MDSISYLEACLGVEYSPGSKTVVQFSTSETSGVLQTVINRDYHIGEYFDYVLSHGKKFAQKLNYPVLIKVIGKHTEPVDYFMKHVEFPSETSKYTFTP